MESKLGFKPVPTAIAVGAGADYLVYHSRARRGDAAGLAFAGDVCGRDCGDYRQGHAHRRDCDDWRLCWWRSPASTSDKPADAVKDALSSFTSPLIWLIGVAIMISRGILKTGLGARIGYLFIAVWGKNAIGHRL